MSLQKLADEFNGRVNDDIQGLPITLVVTKLMTLTAEFMNKAYELGKAENQEIQVDGKKPCEWCDYHSGNNFKFCPDCGNPYHR